MQLLVQRLRPPRRAASLERTMADFCLTDISRSAAAEGLRSVCRWCGPLGVGIEWKNAAAGSAGATVASSRPVTAAAMAVAHRCRRDLGTVPVACHIFMVVPFQVRHQTLRGRWHRAKAMSSA